MESARSQKNIAVGSSGGFVEEIGQIVAQLVFRNELVRPDGSEMTGGT
jgi:hypothetical protein